ncbi:MAG: hypothetical protein M0R80_13145 [Proteobacteria bacterium]|jgi:hypothetical protein|nr:hypothetical protein [Pseudomonadota bacterium]
MMSPSRIAAAALALSFAACAPVSVTRIGPTLPAREAKCAVEVLDRGELPGRPYRDVGLVTIESCEDYRLAPCRGWLEEAVCALGGQVAYVSEERREENPGLAPMRVQVLAAVYVSDLRPDAETDPVLGARACDPPAEAAAEGPEKCLE